MNTSRVMMELIQEQQAEIERLRAELEALRNQEPVAWMHESGDILLPDEINAGQIALNSWKPLIYAELAAGAQPAPSGLETRMYQDAEGKRPVTGVNQPVGLVRQSWVPKRKPLTEPEIFKAYTTLTGKRLPYIGSSRAELIAVVRMTEAAHGIKE